VVIDLGDASAAPESPGSPRPAGLRPVALVASLLAVLALGGSAAVLVTEELPGAFALSPSALFTSGFIGTRAVVRRYSLTGKSIQWSTDLRQSVGAVQFSEVARVLAVTSPESAQASFLDSDTGAILWRRTSGVTSVFGLSGDSVLMKSASPAASRIVLQRVDARTGATLWSRELDASGYLDADGSSRIITVDRKGRGAVLNPADGEELTAANLGVAPDRGRYIGNGDLARFVTIGDRLYLTRRKAGAASLTAYRLTDLRRLWRSTATPFGWPTACGEYLCVSTAAGMTALDADSGKARWSSAVWRHGFDSRLFRIPGPPRVVVTDAAHTPRRALLDPATGRVRSMLGNSEQLGALVMRIDTKRIGRVWIQTVDARDELRTVGAFDGVSLERCTAAGSHLACAIRNGRVSVWRIAD
jgi:outer membrane protein assembly factor BamB